MRIECPACKHIHDPAYPCEPGGGNDPFLHVSGMLELFLPAEYGEYAGSKGAAWARVCPLCGNMRMVSGVVPDELPPKPSSRGPR